MTMHARGPLRRLAAARTGLVALAAALLLVGWSGAALADPAWEITSIANTTAQAGGTQSFLVQVRNVGDVSTDGTDFTVTATLPPGMTGVGGSGGGFSCTGTTTMVCANSDVVSPLGIELLTIDTTVDPGASGLLTASFDVTGGGTSSSASTVDPTRISATPPGFGVDAFDGQVLDASGDPLTQAGGHPSIVTTSIDFNTHTDPSPLVGDRSPVEPVRDISVDLPPGFVGAPAGAVECTATQLANSDNANPRPFCPPTSQVGVAMIRHSGHGVGSATFGPVPVFNMVPPQGVPARFGFNVVGTVAVLDAELRSGGDYGLTVNAKDLTEGLAIVGTTISFWGVPSDQSHDAERACSGQLNPSAGGPTCGSGAPRRAFFRNPTSCTPPGVGLPTTLHVDSWFHPGTFEQANFVSHLPRGYPYAPSDWGPPVGTTGCESVPFDPVLRGQPVDGSKAGEPSAFTFDLTLPQSDDPDAIGEADLRKAVVTLPQGVRVSPSSADGLKGCSQAQIALRSSADPACPNASKIGSLTIDTPLIDQQLTGSIYLATPFDNPSNSLIAIYLVARGPGLVVKLPGTASMDPVTGQITTTFDDNPQLPFSRLHLEFDGGSRAPLTLPSRCDTYTTRAVLTGWNGATVRSDSSFTLTENAKGQPCPSKFSPGFSAGTASNSAGSSSSFLLRFTRDDEDQELKALTVNLASGLTGKIASADLCANAAAAAGTCGTGSKIGDVTVGAGAGTNPFYITNGRAYLTGPYKGAPYGVSIVVPAVAGPFDLGNVVVRSALFVDKHTADVRIVSDPLPTILQGIPLDVRDVRVNVNKPGFFLNPTSCAKKTIAGVLTSTEGATAHVADHFQASECASLGFKPRMVLRVGGRGHTHRGQTTPLLTTVTMPKGDANLRFVRVTLPRTINARLNTINDACTRTEFENDVKKCAHAVAGSATASTPLLRAPLRGKVYFVKNGHAIPDLFVALRGQVAFDLVGRISIVNNRLLRTTFEAAPDVPIRSFTLKLLGGPSTASIGATTNLCSTASRRQKVALDYIGQNGKVRQIDQALRVGGCAKHSKAAGHRRR